MEDLFGNTICIATVARDLKKRADVAEQQYQEGQISAAEKEKILQTLDKVQCVPIVPRKILEMVIERLVKTKSGCVENGYADYVITDALEYTKSLLNQFEEGKWTIQ